MMTTMFRPEGCRISFEEVEAMDLCEHMDRDLYMTFTCLEELRKQ